MAGEKCLHEEGSRRVLEGCDRTGVIGKGGLEMCERLLRRLLRGAGQLDWRADAEQCRADLALGLVEPFPEALQGSVTEVAVDRVDSSL